MSDNPLVAEAHSSTAWYAGLGLAEDAAQISSGIHDNSWVDGTLGGVGGTLDVLGMVIDPLGSLVAWGVGWLMEHVKPLKEALDWLAGNPDEIAAHAATWRNASSSAAHTHQQYADAVRTHTAGWAGASGDAYRGHAAQQLDAIGGIATASEAISYAVEGAGLLVGLVRGIVRDLVAQFVATPLHAVARLVVSDEPASGSPARLPGEIPGRLAQDVALFLQLPDPPPQFGVLFLDRARRL